MKTLSFVLLLTASVAFVLGGCSDNLPCRCRRLTNQYKRRQPWQNKLSTISKRSRAQTWIPQGTTYIDPGNMIYPAKYGKGSGLKSMTRGLVVRSLWNVTAWDPAPDVDRLSGNGVLEMNFNADYVTGKGHTWGKLTLDPFNDDGVWECSWVAETTFDPARGWVCPIKSVGQGRGGGVDGMHLFYEGTIILWAIDGWTLTGSGSIR